ncbi:MAG: hypothetical protein JO166_09950, partial [Deltaproteobacteria bacterium]|nr:hypothetical protein [Deltaproteobacteria bacterium]
NLVADKYRRLAIPGDVDFEGDVIDPYLPGGGLELLEGGDIHVHTY